MQRKWLILGAAMLIQLCLGTLYAWSVFIGPLEAIYGFTRTQTQIVFSLNVAAVSLAVLFAGGWQDKIGPRKIVICGGALFGGGYLAAGLLSHGSFPIIVTAIGIISGIGSGLAYIGVVTTGIKWFPEKRGLVSGLIVGGMGAGTMLIAGIAAYLIRQVGVLETFSVFGIFFLVFIPFAAIVFENPPADFEIKRIGDKQTAKEKEISRKEMLKTTQFWLLWAMFVCGASAGLMYIGVLKSFGEKLPGITHIMAAGAVVLFAVGSTVGRVSLGWLSDKIGLRKTMFLMFATQAIMMSALIDMISPYDFWPNFLSIFRQPSSIGLSIVSVLIGFNFGANFSLFPSATSKWFGMKNLGANYGVMFTAFGTGGLIGPIINGKIFDLTGSCLYAFIFAGILCFIAALLSLRLKTIKF